MLNLLREVEPLAARAVHQQTDELARWSHLAAVVRGCLRREVHEDRERLHADRRFLRRTLRSRRTLLDEPYVRAVLDGGVAVDVQRQSKRHNRRIRHLAQDLGNPLLV